MKLFGVDYSVPAIQLAKAVALAKEANIEYKVTTLSCLVSANVLASLIFHY